MIYSNFEPPFKKKSFLYNVNINDN